MITDVVSSTRSKMNCTFTLGNRLCGQRVNGRISIWHCVSWWYGNAGGMF